MTRNFHNNAETLLYESAYEPVGKYCQYTVVMYWYLLLGTEKLGEN